MHVATIRRAALLLLAAAGALGFAVEVRSDAAPLDGVALQPALAGAATRGINLYGNPYTVRFLADGTIEGVAGHDDEYADSGTWWVEGDTVCRRWSAWLEGATDCFSVTIEDAKIHWTHIESGDVVTEDYAPPH